MRNIYKLDDASRESAKAVVAEWSAYAFRTGVMTPAERETVKDAVEALYRAGGKEPPPRHRIVIAPSPMVARFAAGAAAWIWHCRKNGLARAATDAATRAATRAATDDATYAATYAATRAATDAKKNWWVGARGAAAAVRHLTGIGGLKCATLAYRFYQGGSAWAFAAAYTAFGRDHAKLAERGLVKQELYDRYAPWETLAKLSGFRFMHEQFCIVSDRPLEYHVDERNRPHCETGPFVRWSDGSGFYAWHGARVPAGWIENRATLDPREVIAAENVEHRAAGAAIIGWPKMLSVLDAKVINDSGSDDIGTLIELTLPGLDEPGRFLKAKCPRNGIIVEGVPRVSDIDNLPIETALAAQAWRIGDPQSDYAHPPRRT